MDLKKLTEDDLQRIADKTEDLLLHPNSVGLAQDITCPKIFFQSWGHGSGIGDWVCALRENSYGDLSHGGGSENLEHLSCNCSNYLTCSIYSAEH